MKSSVFSWELKSLNAFWTSSLFLSWLLHHKHKIQIAWIRSGRASLRERKQRKTIRKKFASCDPRITLITSREILFRFQLLSNYCLSQAFHFSPPLIQFHEGSHLLMLILAVLLLLANSLAILTQKLCLWLWIASNSRVTLWIIPPAGGLGAVYVLRHFALKSINLDQRNSFSKYLWHSNDLCQGKHLVTCLMLVRCCASQSWIINTSEQRKN